MRKEIIFCLLTVLLLVGCKEEVKKIQPIRPVRVFKVEGHAKPEMRTFPGKVKATREVTLAFRVPGQIVELKVKEGDFVKKGQLIAQLDQRDFQAAVADLEAKIIGAQSVLNEAKLNIERSQKLISGKIIAQSEFDSAQSNFATSRANVLSLKQSLRRARLNMQYTRLEAPFDGVVAVKEIDNHEYVQAKEPIVQLEDTSSLDVVMNVPEAVWVKAFKSGNMDMGHAVATFEAFPGQTFPLTMKEFQTKANAGTQTYEVTLNMVAPKGLSVHPGMTAEIKSSMPNTRPTSSVNIPVSAVAGTPEGGKFVWLLKKDNTVSKRKVEVGRILNDMFSVDNGVTRGETIVVAGVHFLHEGQKVKILEGRIGGRE